MNRKIGYLLLILLCLLLGVGCFSACSAQNDLWVTTGMTELHVNAKGKITAVVTLDTETLEAHEGESISLYEILPGESMSDAMRREPLAKARASSEMRFEFAVFDGTRTHLYSSFVACFANGECIANTTRTLEDPTPMATDHTAFPSASNPKGLTVTDADGAAALETAHALLDVSFDAFYGTGGMTFSYNDTVFDLSSARLTQLDASVATATAAGMQVSLRLRDAASVSEERAVALLDFLTARYSGGDYGTVSALFVDALGLSEERGASLLSVSHKALCSRVANGRVYVICHADTVDGAVQFFEMIGSYVSLSGDFSWYAAVIPKGTDELPWETESRQTLTVRSLASLEKALRAGTNAPVGFAVCDLCFEQTDETVQAACFAYSYAMSVQAGANLVFYGVQVGDVSGLLSASGRLRTVGEFFKNVDAGLNPSQQYLCKAASESVWEAVVALPTTRTAISGNGSKGSGLGTQTSIFSLNTAQFDAIFPTGGASPLVGKSSTAIGKTVLFTWIPSVGDGAGIRGRLSNGEALSGATSVSVQTFVRNGSASGGTLTLRMRGTGVDGKTLTYEAGVAISCGSWQTVSFDVSGFTTGLRLSEACVVEVLATADETEDTPYAELWISRVDAYSPASSSSLVLPLLLTVTGFVLGIAIFLIYHRYSRRRTGGRREES